MNSKYIRVGCIVLSVFLFLFSGWLRIKGDYRTMWKAAMAEMMSEYTYAMEEMESYGDLADMLGSGFDMDMLEDVEKFINRIEDGKLSPLEAGLMAPKIGDIMDTMSFLMAYFCDPAAWFSAAVFTMFSYLFVIRKIEKQWK